MTQARFSDTFGFSLDAVKHWEGGRRTPESSARAFLTVIARNPTAGASRPPLDPATRTQFLPALKIPLLKLRMAEAPSTLRSRCITQFRFIFRSGGFAPLPIEDTQESLPVSSVGFSERTPRSASLLFQMDRRSLFSASPRRLRPNDPVLPAAVHHAHQIKHAIVVPLLVRRNRHLPKRIHKRLRIGPSLAARLPTAAVATMPGE